MPNTNKMTLVEKLTNIADGFRESRGLTETLSLDEMATLAAEPSIETQQKTIDITSNGTYELYPDAGYALSKVITNVNVESTSKLPQVIDKTVTEITAEDLEGATKIGRYAFCYCDRLTSVTIPNSVTSIEYYAFQTCTSLTNIDIPNTVMSINNGAFYQCANLMSIILPNGITSLSESIFYQCTSLTSIIIPNDVTSIGYSAFGGCTGLTSVTIPNSVTSIGRYTFQGCTSLTNLTIPINVTNIQASALIIGSSTNKATITFLRTTPPSITTSTFNASNLNKIIVPAGSGEAYRTATNWANFADYIEEATA